MMHDQVYGPGLSATAQCISCRSWFASRLFNGLCLSCRIKNSADYMKPDDVHHPDHYNEHPSGVECIDVVEHMNFCLGNAIKYIWRAGLKGDAVKDLQKAKWYIEREINRLEKGSDHQQREETSEPTGKDSGEGDRSC